jgi:small-conductance mechanosensitive channel
MVTFNELMVVEFFSNSGQDYLMFAGFFFAILVGLKIFELIIVKNLKRLSKKTQNDFDDAVIAFIEKINWNLFILVSFFISVRTLQLPKLADTLLNYAVIIVVVYYATKFITMLISYFAKKHAAINKEKYEDEDTTMVLFLGKLAKIVVWIIAILLLLSNLGVNITSLVAGLGIGGIAVAFALQNILGDLFSSFTIYFDKPFRVGDFIIIGTDMGVVKHIGIKSTRIQTLQGQELVVSNSELTNTRINNYKKMEKRRIVFAFGVEYGTPLVKTRKIPKIVKDIFKSVKLTTLDRIHFKSFGDSALLFEAVYYLDSSDYNVYMDTQQQINLALKEHFEKEGIVFAFPTQTLHVIKDKW